MSSKCDACRGTGEIQGGPGDGARCPKCGGSGRMQTGRELVSGDPVPANASHTVLKENGQQYDYVVLSPEERAKGFVKPLRHSYIHAFPSEVDRQVGCGVETRMGLSIAETYAREPKFYSGTFCVGCRTHFPLNQFIWVGGGDLDGEPMDTTLQAAWLIETQARRAAQRLAYRQNRIAELKAELGRLEAESV